MLLSNPARILYATSFLSLFFAGCGLWQDNDNSPPKIVRQLRKELPFSTREPEVFTAEIVLRAGETERLMSIARDGEKRRIDYDRGTDSHRSVLISDKEYLIYFKRGAYSESDIVSSTESAAGGDPLSHLLDLRDYTEFEEMGREGSIVRFRARVNDSLSSDVMIFYDEAIALPVKQEFYAIDGETRTLQYSVEIKGFTTAVDPAVFQVPAGFRLERSRRGR